MKKYIKPQRIVNDFFPEATFDYHTAGVLSPYEIERYFDEFLLDCDVLGYRRVLIITGKGQVVKPLVSRLLKLSKKVESYKIAGYFNGQDGAFEVILK